MIEVITIDPATTELRWTQEGRVRREQFAGVHQQRQRNTWMNASLKLNRRNIMSEPLYDQVILTTSDDTASRILLGGPVGGLNEGVTTAQQGLLVPSPVPTTLPAITATVYYRGVALSPQPSVLWELSCGANIATIDQNGVITRQSNPNASGFDSNGLATSGDVVGGLIQVSATVLRGDRSQSGVRGVLNVTIQNSAARQFLSSYSGQPFAANSPSGAAGFYGLVED